MPFMRAVLSAWLIVLMPVLARAEDAPLARPGASGASLCIECIRIRVGIPHIVHGPSPGIPDNPFSEIKLPNGRFRGFSANGSTYAIDGATSAAMTGVPVEVLGKAARGQYGESGKWINSVERSGNELLGWVHDETGDARNRGLKSMSLATSKDDGLHWQDIGQIITGKEGIVDGRITGEGDCHALNGEDGFFYAYCGRTRDHATIVARAPVSNSGPGHWLKYLNGAWSEPGLGGDATALPDKSAGLARWTTTGRTVGLGTVPGGIGLFFSTDHIAFAALREPLLAADPEVWARPAPSDLLTYFSLLDALQGGSQLGNKWLLAYLDLQPNESFDKRYLVLRPIDVTISPNPVHPQVGVMLARWHDLALHDRWSTTAAVPGNDTSYKVEKALGYLMTAPDPANPSVELQDCVSQWPGHPDHFLETTAACDAGKYQRLRPAGYAYAKPQEHTVPLYRCYNAQDRSHFVSNAEDCEQLGKMERLLGYALSQ